MKIIIEPVTNNSDEAAILRIRRQVFEREMGIALDYLNGCDQASALHLLARAEPNGDPVAALSVVETSSNQELHQGYGLKFRAGASVARYTQLAVLKPYRGLNIPLRLMLAAHRRFVVPNQFDYTWLLFDAERVASSSMHRWLAFIPSENVFMSEYGRSRTLVRDERAPQSEQAVWRAEQYVEQTLKAFSPANQRLAHLASSI